MDLIDNKNIFKYHADLAPYQNLKELHIECQTNAAHQDDQFFADDLVIPSYFKFMNFQRNEQYNKMETFKFTDHSISIYKMDNILQVVGRLDIHNILFKVSTLIDQISITQ